MTRCKHAQQEGSTLKRVLIPVSVLLDILKWGTLKAMKFPDDNAIDCNETSPVAEP